MRLVAGETFGWTCASTITCNGAELRAVIIADEEAGYAVTLMSDKHGAVIFDPEHGLTEIEHYGRIVIAFRDAEERALVERIHASLAQQR